ncbi:hypothetical protein [Cohnella hongkongensis]|uniref:Uncharacterized protein n=1 Tax=Cohnella hongkongensis TaxID=178337 RepID=A0ABV9F9P1_9BACL
MDFSFEILDSSTINIRFNYGGTWFEFNLFLQQEQWILHPYDASLLGNPEMCRLVVADLLANKAFQVMLAKERILLSNLRTSVDVSGDRLERIPSERSGRGPEPEPADDLDRWIQSHSFEEIVRQEQQGLQERLQLYQTLLQRMFYENMGPGEEEFDKVQEMTRIFKDAFGRLNELIDSSGDGYKDRFSGRRRF